MTDHYRSSRNAVAGAGLILLFVLFFLLVVAFVAGFVAGVGLS